MQYETTGCFPEMLSIVISQDNSEPLVSARAKGRDKENTVPSYPFSSIAITIWSKLSVLCSSFSLFWVVEGQLWWRHQILPSHSAIENPKDLFTIVTDEKENMKKSLIISIPAVSLSCTQYKQAHRSASSAPLPFRQKMVLINQCQEQSFIHKDKVQHKSLPEQ